MKDNRITLGVMLDVIDSCEDSLEAATFKRFMALQFARINRVTFNEALAVVHNNLRMVSTDPDFLERWNVPSLPVERL